MYCVLICVFSMPSFISFSYVSVLYIPMYFIFVLVPFIS
jgi:hypothetical protein